MNGKGTVLYIGNFCFPDKNAAANRVVNNGRVLRSLGYNTIFIGDSKETAERDKLINTKQLYDGFIGYSLPYPRSLKSWLNYKAQFQKVINYINSEVKGLRIIIIYGSPTVSLFISKIRKWCVQNNVIFLVDSVDWMSATSGSLFFRAVKYLDTTYKISYLYPKADGIIAISNYLESYYSKKGCKSIVIPPLVDCKKISKQIRLINNDKSKSIKFVYIGVPFPTDGRKVDEKSYKDRLDVVIDYLCDDSIQMLDWCFDIYGLTLEQYTKVISRHKDLINNAKGITFRGAISHNDAMEKLAEGDFTFLFRDINRMTSAGFSTKFVESISCGTPVIATKTSDLGNYLVEGQNGFFIDINDRYSAISKLRSIILMDKSKVYEIKEKCSISYLFHYENYIERLETFLTRVLHDN